MVDIASAHDDVTSSGNYIQPLADFSTFLTGIE
jgi:hypothetical protein